MTYNSSYNPYTDEEDTSNNMFGVTNTNAANNLNNQFAFRPGSLKDTQIKNQQMYQDEGYPAPKLDQLKQEDWDQFQKKGIRTASYMKKMYAENTRKVSGKCNMCPSKICMCRNNTRTFSCRDKAVSFQTQGLVACVGF